MGIWIIVGVLIVIFLGIAYLVWYYGKNKKLSSEQYQFFVKNYKKIISQDDLKAIIIDIDKLYHKILIAIWYQWDFWNILKSNPKHIENIDKVWELHKLRNKLVHDFVEQQNNILLKSANEYKKEIQHLLEKVS